MQSELMNFASSFLGALLGCLVFGFFTRKSPQSKSSPKDNRKSVETHGNTPDSLPMPNPFRHDQSRSDKIPVSGHDPETKCVYCGSENGRTNTIECSIDETCDDVPGSGYINVHYNYHCLRCDGSWSSSMVNSG